MSTESVTKTLSIVLTTEDTELGAGYVPIEDLDISTKEYVDAEDILKLNLTGGTVTGQIKGITPVADEDLSRKDYVDVGVITGGGIGNLSGTTPTMTLDTSSHFFLAATANFTLTNPTGITQGQVGFILVTQDATGGWIMTLDTYFITPGGAAITLSTAASAKDLLRFTAISTTEVLLEPVLDIK